MPQAVHFINQLICGTGRKDSFSFANVVVSGALAGAATYATNPTSAEKSKSLGDSNLHRAVRALKDTPAAKEAGQFFSNAGKAISNVAKKFENTGVGKTTTPIINKYIDDSTGGSHSYTLPVVEKVVDNMAKTIKGGH